MVENSKVHLFRAQDSKIRELQREQQQYYFSAAFNVVLEKHGWLSINCQPVSGELPIVGPGFVCRETPFQGNFSNFPLIFEGPLDQSVLGHFGMTATVRKASQLQLSGQGLSSQSVTYSNFTVREIPEPKQPFQAPYLFKSTDPLWNCEAIQYQTFSVPEGWQVLLEITSNHTHEPVAITNGRYLLLGVPLFDLLAFQHSFPPLEDAGYYAMNRYTNTYELEVWLLKAAADILVSKGVTLVLAQAWPEQYQSAFSIRHDYDRPISSNTLKSLLEFYEQLGIRSTWFWLKKTFKADQANTVVRNAHEVALHSIAHNEESFHQELDFLAASGFSGIKGVTAHGGKPSAGYIGLRQHQWSEASGLLYGEILGKNNRLPHRAIALQNGIPCKANLVLPTVHQSLDGGVKPEAHYADILQHTLPEALSQGAHCVLMNHPDIHIPELKQLVQNLPLEKVWKATFEEVCSWVDVFKFKSTLKFTDKGIEISFQAPLPQNSTVAVINAKGRKLYTLPKGTTLAKIPSERSASLQIESHCPLDYYFDDIQDIITKSYEAQGFPVASAAATIKHNSDALPKRCQNIQAVTQPQQGSLCAELGCGYGFLALAIHKQFKMKVVGYDCNKSFLEIGQSLIQRHPHLEKYLSLQQLDYAQEVLPKEKFDLVTLYGTFHYLVGTHLQINALKHVYESIKPGGVVCIELPNGWYPVEAFTKLWFVHWLPRQLGSNISVRLGKRTLSDIEHQSPLSMKRLLKETGFKHIKYHPLGRFNMLPAFATYFLCSSFMIAAEK